MTTLLRIDSSLRIHDSYSRRLGDYFVQQWQTKHPGKNILMRDVVSEPIPHLTQQTVDGFFDETSHSKELELSDRLIDELYRADEILVTSPMYNYGISSGLKAYFDLIVRTKKTFTGNKEIKGLLLDKKASIISTMGNLQFPGQPYNPVEIQITSIFNQIGISKISYFPMDGMMSPDKALSNSEQQKKRINQYLIH